MERYTVLSKNKLMPTFQNFLCGAQTFQHTPCHSILSLIACALGSITNVATKNFAITSADQLFSILLSLTHADYGLEYARFKRTTKGGVIDNLYTESTVSQKGITAEATEMSHHYCDRSKIVSDLVSDDVET